MNCLAADSPHLPQTPWACLHETFYLHEETAALPSPSWADPNLCVSDGGRKRGQGKGHRGDGCSQGCNGLSCCFASAVMLVGFSLFCCQKISVLANVPVLMQLYHLKRTLLALLAIS